MTSTDKSYFLVPALDREPSDIPLGSVIADVTSLEKINPTEDCPAQIDTEIYTKGVRDCAGKVENVDGCGTGPYSAFRRLILSDFEAPLSSESKIEYECNLIQTRSFKPSPEFIVKVVVDPAVKSHLEIGGGRAKVFVITGIKITRGLFVYETQKTKNKMAKKVYHGVRIGGPTVFAFQVEQLGLTSNGEPTSESYVSGAVLRQEDHKAEYTVEANELDDEDIDELGVEVVDVINDNGEKCRFLIPIGE